MANLRSGSKRSAKKSTVPDKLKRPRVSPGPSLGSSDDESSHSPVRMSPPLSKPSVSLTKDILRERMVDPDLFSTIGVTPLFEPAKCVVLLFPPAGYYPNLVREFYQNLAQRTDTMYESTVKGVPMTFKSDWLASIFGVSDNGVCPFTTHQPFLDDDLLPLEAQVQSIVGDHFDSSGATRPLVSDLSPLSLLLFRLIHTNVLPRKSGRDRVTYQDIILLSLLQSQRPINMSLLILKHMFHCASHDSMHYPYPALLTKLFNYFELITEFDEFVPLSDTFDSRVLLANRLVVSSDDVLSFSTGPKVGSFAASGSKPPVSNPCNDDLLMTLVEKVDSNNKLLHSLQAQVAGITGVVQSVSPVLDSINDKLLCIQALT